MNVPAQPELISCEEGLGRMLERACAKRWRVANGHGDKEADADTRARLAASKCKGCSYGEKRSKAGAHKGAVVPFKAETVANVPRCERYGCGKPFDRKTPTQRFCSGACRKAHVEVVQSGGAKLSAPAPTPAVEKREALPPAAQKAPTREETGAWFAQRRGDAQADPPPERQAVTSGFSASNEEAKPEVPAVERRCRHEPCSKPLTVQRAGDRGGRPPAYCDDVCREAARRVRENRARAEAEGRALLATQQRNCRGCGEAFTPRYGNERYCPGCKGKVPKDRRTRPRVAQEPPPASIEAAPPEPVAAPAELRTPDVLAQPQPAAAATVESGAQESLEYAIEVPLTPSETDVVTAASDAAGFAMVPDWAKSVLLSAAKRPRDIFELMFDAGAKLAPRPPVPYLVHLGKLTVECRTLDDLDALVQRYGGA